MFRNQAQAEEVCRTLIRHGLKGRWVEDFFFDNFPAKFAFACLDERPRLSGADLVMVNIMFAFWDGDREAAIADVFGLNLQLRRMVGRLVQAVTDSQEEVDRWLEEYRTGPPLAQPMEVTTR